MWLRSVWPRSGIPSVDHDPRVGRFPYPFSSCIVSWICGGLLMVGHGITMGVCLSSPR
ncbi:hypothetical protein LINGRAHAP2_LOCUS24274 [Linum grandiflorum]